MSKHPKCPYADFADLVVVLDMFNLRATLAKIIGEYAIKLCPVCKIDYAFNDEACSLDCAFALADWRDL